MNFSDLIRRFLRRRLTLIWLLLKGNKFLFSKNSYLNTVGYIESIRSGRPSAADGSPLPWMNYGIISFLKERLEPDHVLFEFGAGNSTLFWAQRVCRVVAVEHNRSWYDLCKKNVPPNVEVMLVSEENSKSYVNVLEASEFEFDIIVVDGLFRTECLLTASRHLSHKGVIIFDDSDLQQWREGVDDLRGMGFRQLKFRGLKPTGFGEDETSIFYRSDNCLGI